MCPRCYTYVACVCCRVVTPQDQVAVRQAGLDKERALWPVAGAAAAQRKAARNSQLHAKLCGPSGLPRTQNLRPIQPDTKRRGSKPRGATRQEDKAKQVSLSKQRSRAVRHRMLAGSWMAGQRLACAHIGGPSDFSCPCCA
jgi:hypothetical protein